MRQRTHTDEQHGRLVRVLADGELLAAFYVGKNPKQGYRVFFLRRADDDNIYRSQTVLPKEGVEEPEGPFGHGPSGFDWHTYTTDNAASKWVDSTIWDLGSAEVEEIRITRPGSYDAKLTKQSQDKWDLVEEGKDPVAGDADVASGILSLVRRLTLADVVGAYPLAAKEYGLEAPDTTVLMTLRKKVEKKPEPKAGGDKEDEPKEGEPKEGEAKEEKKDEYVTFHRWIEVGKKVTRTRYDQWSDEKRTEDYYAVHIGPPSDLEDPGEKARSGFVFLVRDYTASQLRKELSDLKAKAEEGKGPGEGEGDEKEPEEKHDGDKPPGDKPAEDKDGEGDKGAGKDEGKKPENDGEETPPGEGKSDEGAGDGKDDSGKGAG
jgi:hypothetical protein